MGKISAELFRLAVSGAPDDRVSCELSCRVGSNYQTLKISSGTASSAEFKLVDPVHDDDLNAGLAQFHLDLSVPETRDRYAEHGLCDLKLAAGIELSGVRVAVRSGDRPSGYGSQHPFFALYLDWTITAAAAGGT